MILDFVGQLINHWIVYITPEVIAGKWLSLFIVLMWEISSGQPPFSNCENDYYFAVRIISGMRPKVVPKTPLKNI